jgi:chemotaxis regulatin CheY-phosphate phosphatase CheZ
MTQSKKKKSVPRGTARSVTEVKADQDLGGALREIVASQSRDALNHLAETVEHLRREFDPSSVTMSTTNIPDSITKLSAVLTETSQAATKVFALVDEQKRLLKEGDGYLQELEELAKKDAVDSKRLLSIIAQCRRAHQEIGSSAHEIVVSQEFQDLSGQKVKKVIKLITGVETYLRTLLGYLKVPLPSAHTQETADHDTDIDQAVADSILKDFGL